MARTKTTPRRILPRITKRFIIKEKLQTPKVVKFGNKTFTVRYKRVGRRRVN